MASVTLYYDPVYQTVKCKPYDLIGWKMRTQSLETAERIIGRVPLLFETVDVPLLNAQLAQPFEVCDPEALEIDSVWDIVGVARLARCEFHWPPPAPNLCHASKSSE